MNTTELNCTKNLNLLSANTTTHSRNFMQRLLRPVATGIFAVLATTLVVNCANAEPVDDLKRDANQALHTLTSTNPLAADLAKKATAMIVFPNIVKAGLIFGGAYGEGVLMKSGTVTGYYNSVTASWGFQAGAQSYGYVVFLMNNKALKYINESKGWEIGTGPSVVVVNEGVGKNLSSSTLRDDAYAFIFDQQGLMASLSIEGTKISRIRHP